MTVGAPLAARPSATGTPLRGVGAPLAVRPVPAGAVDRGASAAPTDRAGAWLALTIQNDARHAGAPLAARLPPRPEAQKPGHRALRRGRVSIAGQVYHVTCTTHQRQPVFDDFWVARTVIRQLRQMDQTGRTKTLAFVLMLDHLHWLFTLESGATLARVIGRFKAGAAHAVNRLAGHSGSLWSPAYYDHAVRRDEDLVAIARYIVANPVRAGLVASVGDYSHWDAVWL